MKKTHINIGKARSVTVTWKDGQPAEIEVHIPGTGVEDVAVRFIDEDDTSDSWGLLWKAGSTMPELIPPPTALDGLVQRATGRLL